MVSWLATYVSRKDKGKEQSFQAVVLGQSNIAMEKSETVAVTVFFNVLS